MVTRCLEEYLNELAGSNPSTTTEVEDQDPLPVQFSLEQNYPNPFNQTTAIIYRLSDVRFVTLRVFDVLGRQVAELVNQEQGAGQHRVVWDASQMPSGIYFYRLHTGESVHTKKLLLLR